MGRFDLAGEQADDARPGVGRLRVDGEHTGGGGTGEHEPAADRLDVVQAGGGPDVVEDHGDERTALALGERRCRGEQAAVPDVHAVELADHHDGVA